MVMVNLILILLLGGVIAMLSERAGENMPRRVALVVILVDLAYLLSELSGMPSLTQLQAPMPDDPGTWLMHFKAQWIPAFGISIELALDGVSLLMVLLTLVLGAIAVSASWTDILVKQGFFEAKELKEAGYHTIEDLCHATKKELCGIKGLSDNKVDKIVEAAFKLLGLGLVGYFKVAWNCFDFFLCAVSIVDFSLAGFSRLGRRGPLDKPIEHFSHAEISHRRAKDRMILRN